MPRSSKISSEKKRAGEDFQKYPIVFIYLSGGRGIVKKKRKHRHQPQPAPKIVFTLPTVRLLKNALGVFESVLLHEPRILPNMSFAKEVVSQLKTKLDDMLQREEWEKETSFDYNEVHILYAAVHMYLINLKSSRQENLIPPCIGLCDQLSVIVESDAVKQIAAKKKLKHKNCR